MLKKTPLKRSRKPLKKNNKSELEKLAKFLQRSEDIEFYTEIWNSRDKKCQLTGKYLGDEMQLIFFHHLINKSQYPQFRYKKWNILQLQGILHSQIEINPSKLSEEVLERLREFENIAKEKARIDS